MINNTLAKEIYMDNIEIQKARWLSQLFDSSHLGLLVVDNRRINRVVNQQFCTLFGYEEAELLGRSAKLLHISNHAFENFTDLAFNSVMNSIPISIDYQFKRKDGSLFWAHVTGEIIKEDHVVLWTITDITDRIELQEELLRKKQQLYAINKLIHMGTWELNLKTKKLSISEEIRHILGLADDEEVTFSSVIRKVHFQDRPVLKKGLRDLLNAQIDTGSTSLRYLRGDETRYLFIQGMLTHDRIGRPISMIGAALDITDQKGLELQLQRQNSLVEFKRHYDDLTGLPNRKLLIEKLEEMLEDSKQNGNKIAILFIDLDDFKALNDALGHTIGDEYLIKIADAMKNKIRSSDLLARLSGDIFVILLNDIENIHVISNIVEKELNMINNPIIIDKKTIYPRMSVGIALYPNDGLDSDTLLKNADAAMYKAKENGGHTYSFYDHTLTQIALERIGMEQELKNAIQNDELVVYYQPQIDALENTFIGMEALVRWQHPSKGLIMPNEFIPMAESLNLIVPLNYWVIENAIKQHTKWYKEGKTPGVLALNLAVKQLENTHSFTLIEQILQKYDCKPEWIEFEVTEGQLMQKPEVAIRVLSQLSNIGIEIAIDDFGTGYSSLAYLKHLPIDKLKIDKSFVDNLPYDKDDVAIAKTVITLSSNLDLKIIAEGVETQEQQHFLMENGCTCFQGYFYSKPLPAKELELFMEQFNS